MRRILAGASVVALVGVAGCGGSSAHRAGGPQGSSAPDSAGPAASSSVTASASAGASAVPSAGVSSASAGTSAAARPASAGPGATAPGTPSGLARAGTYTYDFAGSATTPLGTRKFSGTSTLAVDAPAGAQQHSRESNAQGSQDQTVAVRSGGLYVVDLHIAQQGFDEDFRPIGTALYFPGDYQVGRSWSWSARSTDGKYRIDVASKITGTASVIVGGRSVKTLVADSTLHITGSGFDVTDRQRDWVSTAYALIVKEHAVTDGKAEGFSVHSDVTRTVRSTTPD